MSGNFIKEKHALVSLGVVGRLHLLIFNLASPEDCMQILSSYVPFSTSGALIERHIGVLKVFRIYDMSHL